jgi:hypothetical protein
LCLIRPGGAGISGYVDYGSYSRASLKGSFGIIDETADTHGRGQHHWAASAQPEALLWTLQKVGFSHVSVPPPEDAHEQLLRYRARWWRLGVRP